MTSAVAICNLALAHLGDEANISSIDPPEGSAQADHCAQFYPIARDALLESYPWNFALRRAALAQLSAGSPDGAWDFAYALPSGCLRVRRVYSRDEPEEFLPHSFGREIPQQDSADFVQELGSDGSKQLYSNAPQASVLYISSITDPGAFSPLFTAALARLLASYLAGPVIKGAEGMRAAQAQRQMFEQADGPQARNADAAARRSNGYDRFTPTSLRARA